MLTGNDVECQKLSVDLSKKNEWITKGRAHFI